MAALLIALAVVVGIQPGLTVAQEDELDALFACSEAEDTERSTLCNVCRPVLLRVKVSDVSWDGPDHGLTEGQLRITAESRLRAARLYTDSGEESNEAVLYVLVNILGEPLRAFQVEATYYKRLLDPVTVETIISATWRGTSSWTSRPVRGRIVQSVSEIVDEFLVEYLRVNEEHCPR